MLKIKSLKIFNYIVLVLNNFENIQYVEIFIHAFKRPKKVVDPTRTPIPIIPDRTFRLIKSIQGSLYICQCSASIFVIVLQISLKDCPS